MKLKNLALCGCLTAACWAQSLASSKEAKVDELFRLSKMDALLSRTLQLTADQVKSGIIQQMTGVTMSAEQQKQFNEFQDKVNKLVFDAFSWEHVKPIYTKEYVQEFNDAELDGIVSFYKTLPGKLWSRRLRS